VVLQPALDVILYSTMLS